MTDDRILLADFIGRRNWPTLSFVWHRLNSNLLQEKSRHFSKQSTIKVTSVKW